MIKRKPQLRKGETVWWTIAADGKPLTVYAAKTRREAIARLERKYESAKIEDFEFYKPVKIIVRLA